MKKQPAKSSKDGEGRSESNARSTSERNALKTSDRLRGALLCVLLAMLALVPLALSNSSYRTIVLPKYVVLIFGSSLALFLLTLIAAFDSNAPGLIRTLKSNLVMLVALYTASIGVSTLFGVAPLASFYGSYDSQMGLLSYICFFVCFIGLIVALAGKESRIVAALWVIVFTGLVTAAYAFAQFVGRDPFLSSAGYTFPSPGGPVLRVPGALGHSNYLGNFLLYTTPISVALGIASSGSARRIALGSAALSVAAIGFSGTRGAWLGLLFGAAVFFAMEWRRGAVNAEPRGRRHIIVASAVTLVILAAIAIVAISPRSRSIVTRARSFATDGLTGSGRTILWRDAVKMVPAYAVIGCGPEGFSKAFLPYKSEELARSAPQINNESSHNSYLDSVISYGIAGAILYMAIIACVFLLLVRARRAAANRGMRLILTGLTASFAAVCAHNIFIYNQIPTGLYFFSFLALAFVAHRVATSEASVSLKLNPNEGLVSKPPRTSLRLLPALGGMAAVIFAGAHSVGMAGSDSAIKRSFDSARAGSFDQTKANGEAALLGPNGAGAYDFQCALALTEYADRSARGEAATGQTAAERAEMRAKRKQAIDLALMHAEKALDHSLTPEANCVLLAYVSLKAGDHENLRKYAEQAVKWDPGLFSARWLMAEALLAAGDQSGAATEAKLALALNPSSLESRSVLSRARGDSDDLLKRARKAEKKGKLDRAQAFLVRSVNAAKSCVPCHRALALFWERRQRWSNAIAEWMIVAGEELDTGMRQQAEARIEDLKKR